MGKKTKNSIVGEFKECVDGNNVEKDKEEQDKDLLFLSECTHQQLQKLVKWIVYDPVDGKKRLRENMSKIDYFQSDYNHHANRLIPHIIDEIHGFGANVIIPQNTYREILEKVCDKLNVNYHPLIETERLEIEMLKRIWDLELNKLTLQDIEQISLELVRDYNKYTDGVFRSASYRVVIPCVLYIAFFRIASGNNSYYSDDLI